MSNPVSKLRSFLRAYRWRALLPGWLFLVSGSWVADGVKGEVLFGDWPWGGLFADVRWLDPDHRWPGLTFAFLCFAIASLWLYSYRRDFAPVRSLSQSRSTPHRSLVILVSTPNEALHERNDGSLCLSPPDGGETWCWDKPDKGIDPLAMPELPQFIRQSPSKMNSFEDNLDKDIVTMQRIGDRLIWRWNWLQLLRGVRPHAEMVERVRLAGSSGERGSFKHLELCEKLLRRYLPDKTIITRHPRKVDFEDFNGLARELRDIVTEEKKVGMTDEDIIIDITGGQKTTSIAGSSITFTTRVTFQYVSTQPPRYEVYAYDVVHQAPPER